MRLLRKDLRINSPEKAGQKGFSLVEVLIAMVIFLIVTSSIYALLNLGKVSRDRSSRRTTILKNARAAVHLIGRDALNAGLGYHQQGAVVPDDFISTTLQLPTDADTNRDILTSVIAGNDLFTNDLQSSTTERTDLIAFAFRDLAYFNGNTTSIERTIDVGSNPDWTRLETEVNHASDLRTYDLVLIESDSSQVAAVVSNIIDSRTFDVRPGDPLGLNLAHDGTGNAGSLLKKCSATVTQNCTTYLASAKRFFWVSYKVKQNGTLIRTIYGNNPGAPANEQIQERPLAYNVKDLQITYLLKDGTKTDDPAAGPDGIAGTADDTPNKFNEIRQLTVSIEVQSTELDEQTGKPEIIRLDATFSLRNLQYDQG